MAKRKTLGKKEAGRSGKNAASIGAEVPLKQGDEMEASALEAPPAGRRPGSKQSKPSSRPSKQPLTEIPEVGEILPEYGIDDKEAIGISPAMEMAHAHSVGLRRALLNEISLLEGRVPQFMKDLQDHLQGEIAELKYLLERRTSDPKTFRDPSAILLNSTVERIALFLLDFRLKEETTLEDVAAVLAKLEEAKKRIRQS